MIEPEIARSVKRFRKNWRDLVLLAQVVAHMLRSTASCSLNPAPGS